MNKYIILTKKGLFRKKWVNVYKDGRLFDSYAEASRSASIIAYYFRYTEVIIEKVEV